MSFLLSMFSRNSTANNTKISEDSSSRNQRKSKTPTKVLKKIESPIRSPVDVKNIPLLVPKEEALSVEREPIPQISKRKQAKTPPPTIPFKMPMDMTTYLKKLTENKLDAPKKGCLKKMGNHSFAADISQSSLAASPLRSFISEPSPKTLVKKWDEQKQLNVAKARAELLAVVPKKTEPVRDRSMRDRSMRDRSMRDRSMRGITPIKYTNESFDEQIKQAIKRINRRSRTQPPKTPKTPASAKKRILDDTMINTKSGTQFEPVKHIAAKKIDTISQLPPKTPAPAPKAKENNKALKTFPKTPIVKKMRMVPLKGLDESEKKQMNLSMPLQTPASKRKYDQRLNKTLTTDEPSKKKSREDSTERRIQPPRFAKSNPVQRFALFYLNAGCINKKMNQTIDRSLGKPPIKAKEEPGKTPKSRKTISNSIPQTIKKDEMKAKRTEKINTKTLKVNELTTKNEKEVIQKENNKTSKRNAPEPEEGVSAKKPNLKDQEKKKINDKEEMPKNQAKKRGMPSRSVTLKQKVKEVIVDKRDEKKPITKDAKTVARGPKRRVFGDVKNTLKKESVTLQARYGQSEATKEQIVDLDLEKKKNNLNNSSFASLL